MDVTPREPYNDKNGYVEDSRPLGLNLSKSQSFCDFVSTRLSRTDIGTLSNVKPMQSERLKASNIPAIFLKIGSWERFSAHEGDLTVKFYFAKKKIVWEILDRGLKSKIEIPWSDIESMRGENHYGTLEIMLSNPPKFYRESTPQPKKHTIWHATSDFTGGQANIYRKHYVQFPIGLFDRHYEKLLQYDPRLFEISQRSFHTTIDDLSPVFKCYVDPPNISFNNEPSITPTMLYTMLPSQYYTIDYNQPSMFPNFAYIQNNESLSSSVIDFHPMSVDVTKTNIPANNQMACEKTRCNYVDMQMMSEPTQFDETMYTKELLENGTYKINHEGFDSRDTGSQPMWPETLNNMCSMMEQFASYEQPAQWELHELGSGSLYYLVKSTI